MGHRPKQDEGPRRGARPLDRERDAGEGRVEGWLGGSYGGPVPVRSKKRVSDIAGKAPGGGAPAGNAAVDKKA